MYTVYVLRSQKDGNLYIGCTSDLKKRFDGHNLGKVKSTKSRIPFILVYSEQYKDKYEAFSAEKNYKTARGKKVLLEKVSNCRIV